MGAGEAKNMRAHERGKQKRKGNMFSGRENRRVRERQRNATKSEGTAPVKYIYK